MKGGTAAIVVAAERLARAGGSGLELVLCAGEETGCEGALALAARRARWASAARCWWPSRRRTTRAWRTRASCGRTRWRAGRPRTARCRTWARTPSIPLAQAILSLQDLSFDAEHPLLGAPTISLGTFSGGININSVPDRAEAGIDVRTVPGLSSDTVLDALRERLGEGSSCRRAWRSTRSTPTRPATGCRPCSRSWAR
jgi:succinyl-diaminopimelate desuccinylase